MAAGLFRRICMDKDLLKKAGRMLVCGFDGLEPGEHARTAARELLIGHWILFARNIRDHEQVAELNKWLARETRSNNGSTPFITIDQEGGIVSRLHGDLNTYPGAMALAAAGGPEISGRAARITAEHLHSLGFNVNLAPVADINSNPQNPIVGPRSFGDDPEAVSQHIISTSRGYLEGGILPVVKHFPGHGDTSEDSHKSLPLLPHPAHTLQNRELIPFIQAIEADIPAIMVAHLLVPALSSIDLPASLNADIIQGLLRRTMGFDGLIMTDCLEMQGISLYYDTGEAVLKAVKAGADLCFISHTLEEQEKGVKALYDGIKSGTISESRIDESLQRQQRIMMKNLPGQWEDGISIPGWSGRLPDPEMENLSRKSLTLLKNTNFLPSSGLEDFPGFQILYFVRPEQFIGENTVSGGDPLDRVEKAFPESRFRRIPSDRAEEELRRRPLALQGVEKLLVLTCDTGFYPDAVSFIQEQINGPLPVGVAVMRTPYEAGHFKGADFLLLGYENTRLAADSLVALLKGEITAEGTCPVSIL